MSVRDFLKGRTKALDSRTPEAIGIAGFTAYASVNETTDYASDLPQFALEDGSIVTDHIIIKPLSIKISGEIGAQFIRITPPNPLFAQVEAISGLAQSILPNYNGAMLSKVMAIKSQAEDVLDRIDNITDTFGSFLGGSKKPDHEQFLEFIESVYYARIPIVVELKNKIYDRMLIKLLTIRRDNISNAIKFDMTLQKADFVVLAEADISAYFSSPASGSGAGGDNDKGAQDVKGNKKNESLLSSIFR